MATSYVEIRHAHLFCGLGGGAKGFNQGYAVVGNMQARFCCLGGIDVDPASVRDFGRMVGVPGTVLDLFDREQYRDFHGVEPPADWREATIADIHRAFQHKRPHIVFLSPPCKGFSGLLSEGKSRSAKYQALNGLTLRGIWLTLEAYEDDLPELLVFENVPLIASRGRWLLDQIVGLLRSFGYVVAETTHDCGQLGGLAQSRKRYLLVARHREKVPSFLYEPAKRPLRAVGDILGRMPLPGDPVAGPMHRIPRLQFKTWVRLAFVEAGSDWRSLNRLAVKDGFLRDYGIVPEPSVAWRDDVLGVLPWTETTGTVTGKSSPTNGRFAVADPRSTDHQRNGYLGVTSFDESSGAVAGRSYPFNGKFSVADPRPQASIFGKYAVTPFDASTGTILSGSTTGQGCFAVADPRYTGEHHKNVYRVIHFEEAAGTITSGGHPSSGGQAVADPRLDWNKLPHSRRGFYGVTPWGKTAHTIGASSQHDNGPMSVADPRLPEANENCVAIIRALDNTWHRPFTTLELAALQSLLDPEEYLELEGLSDSAWRERIGNAVPPKAAKAIAGVIGQVLLLTWAGETFSMRATPIWVQPMIAGLMAAQVEANV